MYGIDLQCHCIHTVALINYIIMLRYCIVCNEWTSVVTKAQKLVVEAYPSLITLHGNIVRIECNFYGNGSTYVMSLCDTLRCIVANCPNWYSWFFCARVITLDSYFVVDGVKICPWKDRRLPEVGRYLFTLLNSGLPFSNG